MRMGTAGFAMIGLIQEGEAVQWHKWQPGTLRVWSPEIAWAGFVQTSAGCCEIVVAAGAGGHEGRLVRPVYSKSIVSEAGDCEGGFTATTRRRRVIQPPIPR